MFYQTLSAGKLVFHSPLNYSILVPEIHRGQYPPPESFSDVETAHGVTKLTHRRHKPLLEYITQRIVAHGELQRDCLFIKRTSWPSHSDFSLPIKGKSSDGLPAEVLTGRI